VSKHPTLRGVGDWGEHVRHRLATISTSHAFVRLHAEGEVMKLGVAGIVALILAAIAAACTIRLDVPPPDIHIDCVEIVLPNGKVTEACPDAGAE
jgi:hypothetical protein